MLVSQVLLLTPLFIGCWCVMALCNNINTERAIFALCDQVRLGHLVLATKWSIWLAVDKIENLNPEQQAKTRTERTEKDNIMTCLKKQRPIIACGTRMDQGVESKAKQTSTNPQRHGSERASQSSLVSVRLSVLGDLHLVSAERRILNSEDRRNGFTWTTPPNLSPSSLLCLLPKRNGVWMAKLGLCKSLRSADILGLLVAFVLTAFCRLRRQQRVQVTSEADSTTLRVMCLIGY
ncbi:hypothetical protein KCV06_g310, partial [Aureobasidium melanogenum]